MSKPYCASNLQYRMCSPNYQITFFFFLMFSPCVFEGKVNFFIYLFKIGNLFVEGNICM